MRTVVLTTPSADARARRALSRALERWPATVEDVPLAQRGEHLHRCAADAEVEFIVVVDADAVLHPDAFGSLRRVLGAGVALAGGRAIVGESQRLGAMFGPPRSGPNPFDLVVLAGHHADRDLMALVRGPIDVPQRGAVVIAADFVRALAGTEFDPLLLHIDLAVHARALGRAVVCEPSLTFDIDEDSRELRSRTGDVRRYASATAWRPHELHRDPPRLRSAFIQREIRIMGNYRGFMRRAMPPIDVLAVAANELEFARAQRSAGALGGGGRVSVCGPENGVAVRDALKRTGERYLLVAEAPAFPNRAVLEELVERIERNACVALVRESGAPGSAALLHCGRIINGAALGGASVRDVIAGAIESLPLRRLVCMTLEPEAGAQAVAPIAAPATLDVVFVSAAQPAVTHQTLQAVLGELVNGMTIAVYPAGSTTTERLLAVHSGLRLMPDSSDVHLAVALNRALAATTAESIAIIRDDVQVPHGFLSRLQAAFGRIPRLGAVVPRVGGAGRPEALPEQSYMNSVEMQSSFDRRAELYAREAMLVDVATTPVIMISREALDVAGGFDETFGFSRLGIEDFTRRLRSANFLVACAEDAYAHLFGFEEASSYLANLDDAPSLRAEYERRWADRREFDPDRDRIPLRTAEPPAPPKAGGLRVLLPLASELEWRRALKLLTELAQTFRVSDPLEVAIGIDGAFPLQKVVGELREMLLALKIPMEETLNVSIDFIPDMTAWRDSGERRSVRVNGIEREALSELTAIDGARDVRAMLDGISV